MHQETVRVPVICLKGSSRTKFNVVTVVRSQKIKTKLAHAVLNPTHVPYYLTNSQTLATGYSSRLRKVDIDVPKIPVDLISWGILACYPCGTFSLFSGKLSFQVYQITLTNLRSCLSHQSCSQANYLN